MTFYERLSVLMKENNVTAKRLCQELKIGKNSVTYWKSNNNTPKVETIYKIANFFNCSPAFLLGKSDEINKSAHEERTRPEELKSVTELSHRLSTENLVLIRRLVEELIEQQHQEDI